MTKGGNWQRGLIAAGASVVAAGAFAIVGVSGASGVQAADTVYASEDGSWCFSTDDAAPHSCTAPNAPANVNITTGQTVDFQFPGNPANPGSTYNQPHNVVATGTNWTFRAGLPPDGDPSTQPQPTATTPVFNQAGDYTFVCEVHGFMTGTIHVTGDPVGTPTPPTPTPTTQPGGGGQTPPPGGTTDTVKPTLRSIKLKAQHHLARVTFTLSENATVTIRVKRGKKLLKSVKVQARAGTRTVKVRSSKFKKGRYTIEVRARDPFGNNSTLATKRLRFAK